MFALRGIALSLSVYALVYAAFSVAGALLGRSKWVQDSERFASHRRADLLFTLRVFPLIAAALTTVALAAPSYLLLEPRAIGEPLGMIPTVLAGFALSVIIIGAAKALGALLRASRTISDWKQEAQTISLHSESDVPLLRIMRSAPPLAATGILRPELLISSLAESLLTENELHTALRHEMAHVRRRDNLKKLILRFLTFPGMNSLETAWIEASEMAADDAAVFTIGQALDLAAALIRLSQLGPLEPPAELTASLVRDSAASVNARVQRLISWNDDRLAPARQFSLWYGALAALTVASGLAMTYSALLVRVHAATEWLVR